MKISQSTTPSILLLEDDEVLTHAAVKFFPSAGLRLTVAHNCGDASILVSRHTFSLAIVDGLLPDDNGVEWIEQVRRAGFDAPIIFISAFFKDTRTRRRLQQQLRVSDVLYKPFTLSALARQVRYRLGLAPDLPSQGVETSSPQNPDAVRADFTDEVIRRVLGLREEITRARASGDVANLLSALQTAHKLHSAAYTFNHAEVAQALVDVNDGLIALSMPQRPPGDHWKKIELGLVHAHAAASQRAVPPDAPSEKPRKRPRKTVLAILGTQKLADLLIEVGNSEGFNVQVVSPEEDAGRASRELRPSVIFVETTPDSIRQHRTFFESYVSEPTTTTPLLAVLCHNADLAAHVASKYTGASAFVPLPAEQSTIRNALIHLSILSDSKRHNVLVVNSDLSVTGEIRELLAREDMMTVFRAPPPPERIASLVFETGPDAIIVSTDQTIRATSPFASAIRASSAGLHLPLLLISSQAQENARLEALRAGFDDVIHTSRVSLDLAFLVRMAMERQIQIFDRANRDVVTGLHTRRTTMKSLRKALALNKQNGQSFAIAMLDIDHFKRVNDTYGHPVGDKVLGAFGALLKKRFSPDHVRGRWGGEEFVVGFPDEDQQLAGLCLEQLLDEFRRTSFPHPGHDPFRATFSAGVAIFPADGQTVDQLLSAADKRLYAAKAAGRARVVSG